MKSISSRFVSTHPIRSLASRPQHLNHIKSFDEIPTESSWIPASVRLMLAGGPGYLHEHCDRMHMKLGPIFRNKLGSNELIFLADPKLIQYVVANEGQYPHHNVPDSWLFYNQVKNVQRGLFFQTGEQWAKLRKAFDKVMLLQPRKISGFSSDILKINTDLLHSWQDKYSNPGSASIDIKDIREELCRWSMEATGFMLFGHRMNCLYGANEDNLRGEQLVQQVAIMFDQTSKFQLLPVKLAYLLNLGTWTKFENASSKMLKIANEYTNDFLARAKKQDAKQSLVKDLIDSQNLSGDEVTRSVVDLIIASADTTPNSLQWMIYLLAKYPEYQDKILPETESISSGQNDCHNLRETAPSIWSFIREASRLYPTAPFLARTLEKDIVLGGYHIPAWTPIVFSLFTTSRKEQNFHQPFEFDPNRWVRSKGNEKCPRHITHSAFASLPFGIGVRMCIGRRLAELEMLLFIASLVQNYRVKLLDEGEDMEIKLKMILCPKKPIGVRLEARD